ncbi:hypothetical protein PM082_002047 [Marasmius tenuissimus]|nr:hypothetical protein PM082_002047 [Marasmius tenuissimus]
MAAAPPSTETRVGLSSETADSNNQSITGSNNSQDVAGSFNTQRITAGRGNTQATDGNGNRQSIKPKTNSEGEDNRQMYDPIYQDIKKADAQTRDTGCRIA